MEPLEEDNPLLMPELKIEIDVATDLPDSCMMHKDAEVSNHQNEDSACSVQAEKMLASGTVPGSQDDVTVKMEPSADFMEDRALSDGPTVQSEEVGRYLSDFVRTDKQNRIPAQKSITGTLTSTKTNLQDLNRKVSLAEECSVGSNLNRGELVDPQMLETCLGYAINLMDEEIHGEQVSHTEPNVNSIASDITSEPVMTRDGNEAVFHDQFLTSELRCRVTSEEKQYICKDCNVSFTTFRFLRMHRRKHSQGIKPFLCTDCGATFSRTAHLAAHKRKHTGEKPFVCKVCDSRFTTNSYLTVHMRKHTGERPYICAVCGALFTTSCTLKRHLQIHTKGKHEHSDNPKPYACKQCNVSHTTNSSLKVHMQSHTGERTYTCKYCDVAFLQASNLKVHMRTHTGEKPFRCKERDVRFTRSGYLKTHIRKHMEENTEMVLQNKISVNHKSVNKMTCIEDSETGDWCEKELPDLNVADTCQRDTDEETHSELVLHCEPDVTNDTPTSSDQYHRNEPSNNRSASGMKSTTEALLMSDTMVMCRTRPYVCRDCNASFTAPCLLKVHMRKHTGKRPYSCEYCDAAFSQSGNLTAHMRSHTGEKPFLCKECGAIFTRSNLKMHVRIHTGERPYVCKECGARFIRSGDLNIHRQKHKRENAGHLSAHIQEHAEQTPGSCKECGTTFASSQVLTVQKDTDEIQNLCKECLVKKKSNDDHRKDLSDSPTVTIGDRKCITDFVSGDNHDEILFKQSNAEMVLQKKTIGSRNSVNEVICMEDSGTASVSSEDLADLYLSDTCLRGTDEETHSELLLHCEPDVVSGTQTPSDQYPRNEPSNSRSTSDVKSTFETTLTPKTIPRSETMPVSKTKSYVCRNCNASFSALCLLNVHMRKHTGNRPYSCKHCGATFSQSGNLTAHVQKHTGEKPFLCKECGATFTRSNHLKMHVRIHTGEKPYVCKECGARFTRSGDLNVHRRKHTKENSAHVNAQNEQDVEQRLHSCKECGATFALSHSLAIDMQKDTDEVRYLCEDCMKKKEPINIHAGKELYSQIILLDR